MGLYTNRSLSQWSLCPFGESRNCDEFPFGVPHKHASACKQRVQVVPIHLCSRVSSHAGNGFEKERVEGFPSCAQANIHMLMKIVKILCGFHNNQNIENKRKNDSQTNCIFSFI